MIGSYKLTINMSKNLMTNYQKLTPTSKNPINLNRENPIEKASSVLLFDAHGVGILFFISNILLHFT